MAHEKQSNYKTNLFKDASHEVRPEYHNGILDLLLDNSLFNKKKRWNFFSVRLAVLNDCYLASFGSFSSPFSYKYEIL